MSLWKVRPYIGLQPCQITAFYAQIVTEPQLDNVFSRDFGQERLCSAHGREFGKKRYLFRIVYRGERSWRVSELCDNILTEGMPKECLS